MSLGVFLLIALLAVSVGVFAFLDAKKSIKQSLPELLRAVFTLAIVGLTVRLIRWIGMAENLLFIIALIGVAFFYIVLFYVIRVPEKEKLGKVTVSEHILSAFFGFTRGWLYFGFFLITIVHLFKANVPERLYNISAFAARLCLLLSF